jgi:hypothetical protein
VIVDAVAHRGPATLHEIGADGSQRCTRLHPRVMPAP